MRDPDSRRARMTGHSLLRGRLMKAFMFDLDGTLLDTLEDIAASCNLLLEARGWPGHPVAAYRHMVGNGFATLIRRAVPDAVLASLDSGALERLVEEGRGIYAAHLHGATAPYPGMEKTLAELARKGFALAVLSNKPDEMTRAVIARQFPSIPFALVRGGRADTPLKPDPAGALAMLREMRVPPEACFYVGDSAVDMRTALAAGMRPVGVAWGFRGEDEVVAAGAACVLRCAKDALALAEGRLECRK